MHIHDWIRTSITAECVDLICHLFKFKMELLTATEANKYPSNEKEVFVPSYGHEDSAYQYGHIV